VATRARVTEREFREVFSTLADCYRAAHAQALERLSRTVAAAAGRQAGWLERVRSGLVALLGFFDDHPSWARLLVLEAPVSPDVACECRQQLHVVLARLLDNTEHVPIPAESPLLTAALTGELIVGGVFSVIRSGMLENGSGQLVESAPSLMAFIVAPYLGQGAARAELEGSPYGRRNAAATDRGAARARAISDAAELPVRLTHRTTLVLRAIAQTPYLNNREIAKAAGLVDEGQTSKLLTRLERSGVIENVGIGASRGEPNAWLLTRSGRRAVELIEANFAPDALRPRRAGMRGVA
jgi:DNA-binding MarR family transcriptional regulator